MTTPELLTLRSIPDYLRTRGLVGAEEDVHTTELDGGVSNIVVSVETTSGSWVVKQSLPRLRVADDWQAKQERTINEARGLRLAGLITPDRVPRVIYCDQDEFALIIERAPTSWGPWKEVLLGGVVDTRVAHSLGSTLGAWHAETASSPTAMRALDDPEAFEQLRVSPYYRATAERLPELATDILAVVESMSARRLCLVHGDFSPKNILVGTDGYWVIDFEVAHRGDPDFDRAFLLTHLLLKAIHRPVHREKFREAATAFLAGYAGVTSAAPWDTDTAGSAHLSRQIGCLLLARSVGKSPAEYLDAEGRRDALALGSTFLKTAPADPMSGFSLMTEKAAE